MRRGFALPTVIVLLLVAGALVATLMERQSVRSLGTARELRAYQEQHAARGLQEVLNMWLRSRPSAQLHELTGDRGHAFDLELADGSVARVYLGDAQASVLAAAEQLSMREASEARQVVSELEVQVAMLARCEVAPDSLAPRVDLFPLPGVSPGLAGLLLPEASSTVLIAGDAVASQEHLEQGRALDGSHDPEAASESLREAIEVADLIVCGRDNLVLNPTKRPF